MWHSAERFAPWCFHFQKWIQYIASLHWIESCTSLHSLRNIGQRFWSHFEHYFEIQSCVSLEWKQLLQWFNFHSDLCCTYHKQSLSHMAPESEAPRQPCYNSHLWLTTNHEQSSRGQQRLQLETMAGVNKTDETFACPVNPYCLGLWSWTDCPGNAMSAPHLGLERELSTHLKWYFMLRARR